MQENPYAAPSNNQLQPEAASSTVSLYLLSGFNGITILLAIYWLLSLPADFYLSPTMTPAQVFEGKVNIIVFASFYIALMAGSSLLLLSQHPTRHLSWAMSIVTSFSILCSLSSFRVWWM